MTEDGVDMDFSDKHCHSDSDDVQDIAVLTTKEFLMTQMSLTFLSPDSDISPDNLDPRCHFILKDGDPLRYFSDLDLDSKRSPILSRCLPRQIRYEGYLYKQGGLNADQGWTHRYMVFDGESLKYYTGPKAVVSLRIIPVSSMCNVNLLPTGKIGRRHQFSLECVGRTFIFAAEDLRNNQTWASYLMEAIIKYKKQHGEGHLAGGTMSRPDISGPVRFKNKKYFVAIKQDKFRYYNNEDDFQADSPIHELSMTLVSLSEVNPTCLRLSSTPGEPQIELSFDNTKDATNWKTAVENSIFEAHGDNTIVDQLRLIEGNTTCADCTSTKTHWASVNLGIVLCSKCAGVHRWLGVNRSKVRSLRMDLIFKENKQLLQLFTAIGNRNGNTFWDRDLQEERDVITDETSDSARQTYIHQKYVDKDFADLVQYSDKEEMQKDFLKAVSEGDLIRTMQLLNSGADMHQGNDLFEGKNALELSRDLNHELLLEYLRQNANIVPERRTKGDESTTPRQPRVRSVYLENNLEKTGPNMRGFLKRWCVLNNGNITYYAEKGGKSVERGCLCLKDVLVVGMTSCGDRQYCFDFSKKDKRRIYRFAAEDNDVRRQWVCAITQIVKPPGVQEQMIADGYQIAGHFYVKYKDSPWFPAWLTLAVRCLRIENVVSKASLTFDMQDVFLVYTFNKGKYKALDQTPNDSRFLDDNQRAEIVIGERLLLVQGIILRDTDRLFSLLEELVKGR